MSTQLTVSNLAIRPAAPPIAPRIAMQRLRVAFIAMVFGAARMPTRWYGLTKRDRSVSFPFEREREFIHEAIRLGATTPERVLDWRLAQLRDDLAQFNEAPDFYELVMTKVVAEQAEALDAQARAHALPTAQHIARAIDESEESSIATRFYCAMMRTGRSLLHSAAV